eukprot:2646802-Prymnesium_polylepis.1
MPAERTAPPNTRGCTHHSRQTAACATSSHPRSMHDRATVAHFAPRESRICPPHTCCALLARNTKQEPVRSLGPTVGRASLPDQPDDEDQEHQERTHREDGRDHHDVVAAAAGLARRLCVVVVHRRPSAA